MPAAGILGEFSVYRVKFSIMALRLSGGVGGGGWGEEAMQSSTGADGQGFPI